MILDKQYLNVYKTNKFTEYTYNYPSKDKKIEIILTVKNDDLQVKYIVNKWVKDVDDKIIVGGKDTSFETTDLKQAWEKFEDFFEETQKEENPQKGNEDPEIVQVLMSVEITGKAFLFIVKASGEEELIHEFNLDNFDISTQNPKYAQLDFTNDSNMPQPFNCEWYLANVDNVIKYSQASVDCTTYLVASNTPDQPGQGGEPTDEDGEPKPSDKPTDGGEPKPSDKPTDGGEPKPSDKPTDGGEPKPSDKTTDGGEPKPSDKPTDGGEPKPSDKPTDGGEPKPSDKTTDGGEPKPSDSTTDGGEPKDSEEVDPNKQLTNTLDFKDVIQKISEQIGKSPNEISSALRSSGVFDTYLTLNKVNVKELMNSLNYTSTSRSKFINEVISDYQNN
jgi:hypothetical protein